MRSSPHNRGAALVLSVLGLLAVGARAQDAPVPSGAAASGSATVLFRDVRIFDGMSGRVAGPSDVLVRGNRIERIGPGLVPEPTTRIIVGSGRVLMPGLIDAHWHSMMAAPSLGVILSGDQRHLTLVAGAESTRTLMRGFTSVRDVGGNVFGLKQAVDGGVLPGPRIYPSGAMISVTSGHGDFRQGGDRHGRCRQTARSTPSRSWRQV